MFEWVSGSNRGTDENRQSLILWPRAIGLAIWTPKDLSALIRWAVHKAGALIQRIQNELAGYALSVRSSRCLLSKVGLLSL